eukprot:3413785-Prymnesium_polylepis.1
MLEADKAALERDLAAKVVSLQYNELQYLQANFQNLATTCAVLVGFGFTGLSLYERDDAEDSVQLLTCLGVRMTGFNQVNEPTLGVCLTTFIRMMFDVAWAICCSLATGFNLLALFISTVAAITGPGVALRGPEGSLTVAIVHMEEQNERALRAFGRGVLAFGGSICMFGLQALGNMSIAKGIATLGCGLFFLHRLQRYAAEIGPKVHRALKVVVRGDFEVSFREDESANGSVPASGKASERLTAAR